MRKAIHVVGAILVGLALTGAVQYTQLVKPVGYVTKDHCTRAEKPCTEYVINLELTRGLSQR